MVTLSCVNFKRTEDSIGKENSRDDSLSHSTVSFHEFTRLFHARMRQCGNPLKCSKSPKLAPTGTPR